MTQEELDLLDIVVSKSEYQSIDLINDLGDKNFPIWKIDTLCNLINDEFMANGLQENWEPNEYGLRLEALLNVINRKRITT